MNKLCKLFLLTGLSFLVACGENAEGQMEGQYYSKDGKSLISFEKNNKAYYTMDILSDTPDAVYDFEIDGDRIILKTPNSHFVLRKPDNGELKGVPPFPGEVYHKFDSSKIPGTYKSEGEIKFLVTLYDDNSGTIGTDKNNDPLTWSFSKEKKEIELVSQKKQSEKLFLKVIDSDTLQINDEILKKSN